MAMATIFKKMLIGRAFTTENGRIKMFGYMDWIMNPALAFSKMLQSIGEKSGKDFLYKLGYDGGKDGAEEMIKYMQLKPRGGWITQKAIIEMLDFIGYGKVEFVNSKVEKNGRHHVTIHVKHNPVIEHASRLFGEKSLVCEWFMGAFAAHGEMELGIKNPKLVENKCVCKGAPYCEWESRW